MRLNVKNEYDKLTKVLLAPVDEEYSSQQKQLLGILKKYNVEIVMTQKQNNDRYQMFVRDPFIVIGNKMLICHMKESIRQLEIESAKDILDKIDGKNRIYLYGDTIVEGGDVLLYNDIIFVGQKGNRTNENGLKFMNDTFSPEYRIIPLYMKNPNPYFPFVHLDCIFNPISKDTVIVYKDGLEEESINIIEELFTNIIYVDKSEQDELVTNVICLGDNVVIVQKRHDDLIRALKEKKFKIEVMDIYDTVKETGYLRCLTCPLERIKKY